MTGILIFSLCAAWDKCNETKNEGLGIRLGLILAGIFMVSVSKSFGLNTVYKGENFKKCSSEVSLFIKSNLKYENFYFCLFVFFCKSNGKLSFIRKNRHFNVVERNYSLPLEKFFFSNEIVSFKAPATGASLNTARTLAPAIFASKDGFIGHWV